MSKLFFADNKFKVWDLQNKYFMTSHFEIAPRQEDPTIHAVLRFASDLLVVQWIGRQDGYGEDLYHGDIIKVKGEHHVIVWDKTTCGYTCLPSITYADRGWDETMTDHSGDVEKVGNVFEADAEFMFTNLPTFSFPESLEI